MDFNLSTKSTRISFRGTSVLSMTRLVSIDSVWETSPRFSMISCMTGEMYSFGIMTKQRTIGSRISSITLGSGSWSGLSMRRTSPFVRSTS